MASFHLANLSPPQITVNGCRAPAKTRNYQLQPPYATRSLPDQRTGSMLNPKRQSNVSLGPPLSPVSPSSLPRPSSVTSHHRPRMSSDGMNSFHRSSPEPDVRNVRVVLRVRPNDPDDNSVPPRYRNTLVHPTSAGEVRVDVDPVTLIGAGASSAASGSKRHPTFNFDNVLGESSTQADLYDATAKDVVEEFLKGHNVTFLAYGQTSSGKSYSMGTTGEDADYTGTDFNARTGLIPRTVSHIFQRAEDLRAASGPGASWECRLSFLELYNEEIIDLLSGSGVQISIREERDGRIIWSGVREAKVRNLAEVMQLLYEGSARRKTGETGMNATSSRSHAIFSLTLVQKRRSNAMSPSASQSIPEVSTPTRQLKRPTSMIGMASSRSPTPSGSRPGGPPTAFGKGSSGLPRPSSFIGPSPSEGDFIVVTSKFNMVDLAGSERLKRTAAQGERMKEGISINSGLLALGNVISTLADPVKAKGHIPYRDSKLTRMLQDSIGGNALTTMIACVSPIEYNINETINTIKYASRARNIKNVAKINAVEAGWDDVEHLQTLVTKLRKQIATIDVQGGAKTPVTATRSDDMGSEKLLQRLAELQREHTELYDRYLAKCSENMRLTSEIRNAKPGDGDALDRFNETVEPVILEYEKVVGALNKQLDELRAELTMISDLYGEQNTQLLEAQTRQASNDGYVTELKGRVAKLSERNTSSEAYIQDLESKLKLHADKTDSSEETVNDLRKEISKLKEANARLSQHTTGIEARLTMTEGHSSTLIAQIEKHEKQALEREQAYRDLEQQVIRLDTTKDSKMLWESLAEKDQRILELQEQLEDQTASREERGQLRRSVEDEKLAQAELREKLEHLTASSSDNRSSLGPSAMSVNDEGEAVPNQSPVPSMKEPQELNTLESSEWNRSGSQSEQVAQLEVALQELATRCAEAESKYTIAEHKIAELTTQLSEAKLIHAELDDVLPGSPEQRDDASESGSSRLQTPKDPSPATSPVRSNASRRGSMPVMSAANGIGVKQRDFRAGRGLGELKRVRPQSLSQELLSAQYLESSPRASWNGPSALRLTTSPSRQSLPAMQQPLRTSQSLEAELRFLHEVVEKRDEELKDREAYIRRLEEILRQQHIVPSRKPSAISLKEDTSSSPIITLPDALPSDIPLPVSPMPGVELQVDDAEWTTEMSPSSTQRFNDLKNTLASLEKDQVPDEKTQARVDNLLKEMAVKESSQRAIIEQQFVQIANLQKANHKLAKDIQTQTFSSHPSLGDDYSPTTPVKRPGVSRSTSISSMKTSVPSPTSALNQLREEHAEEIQALLKGQAESMEELQREHSQALHAYQLAMTTLNQERETQFEAQRTVHERAIHDLTATHESAVLDLEARHVQAFQDLKTSHETAIAEVQRKHEEAIAALCREQEALVQEMETSLSESEEQRRQLKMKADQAAFEVSRIRDETSIQRNNTVKQLADFQRNNAALEEAKAELQAENQEMSRRLLDLEQRNNRKSPPMPPQGPPPSTPLPPLPGHFASPLLRDLSSDGTMSSSSHRSSGSHGSTVTAPTSLEYVGPAVAHLPEPIGQMVQKVMAERDAALAAKQELSQQLESMKEAEAKLLEEQVKAENLTRDLHDAKKTNSKLRAHLEDARQESKRLAEACKEHMSELDNRGNTMTQLSRETGQQRDSLLAANAQVAALKAQLDRAVEQKVNKKLNQRLKCF